MKLVTARDYIGQYGRIEAHPSHPGPAGSVLAWVVPVEPDKIVTTRYENMFGPCDFIDRIDVVEPGTYAIIRIGGDDDVA